MPMRSAPAPLHPVACPIKLNLALSVGPPQADGMHPVATWMVAFDRGDRLALQTVDADPALNVDPPLNDHAASTPSIRLHRTLAPDAVRPFPIDWAVEDDLAYRAARALLTDPRIARQKRAVSIHLEKVIPPGTGLGAGSSNAAAVLHGLNRQLGSPFSTPELCRIAGALGADVPLFVASAAMQAEAPDQAVGFIATGTGTDLTPAPPPTPLHAVVIVPEARCPTALVYQAFDAAPGRLDPGRVAAFSQQTDAQAINRQAWNDLQPAVFRLNPALAQAQARGARAARRPVHLTGSGSGMYCLFRQADDAAKAADRIQSQTGLATLTAASLGTGSPAIAGP